MRYAVLTAKHHDGFALFDTRHGTFSSMHAAYRGDVVREYADAARAAGLRAGLYFSLCDWHHPDYPPFTDEDRPYRFGMVPRPSDEQWQRFLEFLFGQLRELLPLGRARRRRGAAARHAGRRRRGTRAG